MSHIDLTPEDYVRAASERGLHWRAIQKTGMDRDPEFWTAIHRKLGNVIHFTGLNGCTAVASVEIAEAILRRDDAQMSRGLFLDTLGKFMLGRHSLVSLQGEKRRDMRALWMPTFTASTIRSQHATPIAAYARRFADSLSTSAPLDILEAMSLITMRSATRILLGENTESQADAFAACTYEMLETQMRVTRYRLGIVPGLLRHGHIFLRNRSRMRRTIAEVVDRMNGSAEDGSFLGRLASYRDPDTRRRFGRSELIDTGVASLAAATHTTSLLLSWTFHLLSTRPELDEEAHAEIVAACGPGGVDVDSLERVQDLALCRMILLESMRLYPPLWILHRTPKQNYEAEGHRFQGGRLISIPNYAIQRDPRNFERPEEFLPRRWEKRPLKGAFLPFGAGGRACLGEGLAMTQALIILSIFLARFRVASETPSVRPVGCGYLLKSSPPLTVRLVERS